MQGRHQFNSESKEEERGSLERFSFPWSTFITFPANIKRMSYPRLCDCFRGLFVGFQGFCGVIQTTFFWFRISSCLRTTIAVDVGFHNLLGFDTSLLFPLAKVTCQTFLFSFFFFFYSKREKSILLTVLPLHVKFVSVWSCLPLQSAPRLVSATWRKTP